MKKRKNQRNRKHKNEVNPNDIQVQHEQKRLYIYIYMSVCIHTTTNTYVLSPNQTKLNQTIWCDTKRSEMKCNELERERRNTQQFHFIGWIPVDFFRWFAFVRSDVFFLCILVTIICCFFSACLCCCGTAASFPSVSFIFFFGWGVFNSYYLFIRMIFVNKCVWRWRCFVSVSLFYSYFVFVLHKKHSSFFHKIFLVFFFSWEAYIIH